MEVRDRAEGLDLVDRGPAELWKEACNTVQESVTKPPKEKEMLEGKVVVWGAFTNS